MHAANLLAAHLLHPQLMDEEVVLQCPVFEHLGLFLDERRALLAKREHVRCLAGL